MSILRTTIIAIVTLLLIMAALWLWVLASPDPLFNPTARYFPWPIACSANGCLTTLAWQHHFAARQTFSAAANTEAPTSAQALTTITRQHLAHNTLIQAPVTLADARRYRENILNLKNEEQIQSTAGLTTDAYDQYIILPFLEQESLRQQHQAESTDELYQVLAQEHRLFILPFALQWDRDRGVVNTNSLYSPANQQ